MNMKDDILLLITFYERKIFFDRIMEYYDSFDKNELPFIAVSDQSKKFSRNTRFKNIDKWYHLPNLNYYEMQKFIISDLNKKYFFLLSDDDFVIPKGIKLSMNFISKNPDYSVISGQMIMLKKRRNFSSLYGYDFYLRKDLEGQNKMKRVLNFYCNNPTEFNHTIIKSDVMLKALDIVLNSEKTNSLFPVKFWGFILNLVCLIEGKIKTNINYLTLIRIHDEFSPGIFYDENIKYPSILESKTNKMEILNRIKFKNPLTKYISEAFKISHLDTNKLIERLVLKKTKYSVISKFFSKFPTNTNECKLEIEKIKKLISKYSV